MLELSKESGQQIRAEVDRVSFRNDENGWTVIKVRTDHSQELLTVVGYFHNPAPGQHFELFGNYGQHPLYGTQFKAERIVAIQPSTKEAIKRYLSSGMFKGVGEKTAVKIVNKFGKETLQILQEHPERLREIKGITPKIYKKIIESWDEHQAASSMTMFLTEHEISMTFAQKILDLYGPQAIKLITANPFRLASDIRGIGFLSADRIAQSMGIPADSPDRIQAGISYQLEQAEDQGHCFVSQSQLIDKLVDCLHIDRDKIIPRLEEALKDLNQRNILVTLTPQDTPGIEEPIHYQTNLLYAESQVAHKIKQLLSNPIYCDEERVEQWILRFREATGCDLTDEQLGAVRAVTRHRVFILTGGPGVGKTTTANTIIKLLKAMGKSVALAAPTGRAAQRLAEVAYSPAKTIHRLLEWTPQIGTFAKNESETLNVQAVVVDESSMLDIRLAEALVSAVPKTSQLILIGDMDQLPSVGPGNVLRDLIHSGVVPCTRLTKVFRQAAKSQIVQTAHGINSGQLIELKNEPQNDCFFIDAQTPEEVRATIEDLVLRKIPQSHQFHPIRDIQILSPMNRGDLGTMTLSQNLQQLLNPKKADGPEYKTKGMTLRPGDKVIQCVNNYDLSVFNGDIGFVQWTNGKVLEVQFGDRRVSYDGESASDLRLAYAITIHKSQGSEFPVVIIPCTMHFYVMLQRNLFYTGLTRARKLAFFVGSKKALHYAVNNSKSLERQSRLLERLTSG
jgi:exodeoxyribonuclease V alpha subunit